jgi:hypothetical protein
LAFSGRSRPLLRPKPIARVHVRNDPQRSRVAQSAVRHYNERD